MENSKKLYEDMGRLEFEVVDILKVECIMKI